MKLEKLSRSTIRLKGSMDFDDLESNLDRGVQFYQNRQYKRASIAFQKVLEIAKQTNKYITAVYAYLVIGDCYFYQGNYDRALAHFDKARSLAEERNEKNTLALSQVNLAKTLGQFIKRGDVASSIQARYYLTEAIQLFEQLKDSLGLQYAHSIMGDLEAIQGNLEEAKIHFQTAAEIAQTLNKPHFRDYFRRKIG